MVSQSEMTVPLAMDFDQRHFAVRLMEHLVVATFVIDRHSRVIVWNKACERLTGVAAAEVMHTADHWRAFYRDPRPCLADLVAAGRYEDINALYSDINSFGISDFGVSVENWCPMPHLGRTLYLAIDAGPIYDEAGALIAVVETLRDITIQREQQRVLQNLAAKDGLTALANRRSFDEALVRELRQARCEQMPLSLLMIDVDCFKAYNDTYGHQQGDACLKAIAEAITATLRRSIDIAARYGGEEFAVILPRTDGPGAVQIAERLRRAVESLSIAHATSSLAGHVTLSIGAATAADCGLDTARLVAAADEALYKSKHRGRNRTTASNVEMLFLLF